MDPDSNAMFRISPLHRLQWEEAQQRHVILYPEGMVELNTSAAEILKLCDGAHKLDDIVTELEARFAMQGLRSDIINLLKAAVDHGWVEQLST